MAKITCSRCGKKVEGMPTPPLKSALGAEVAARVCPDCWKAWKGQEVMVINEYRLRLFDKGDRARLDHACRTFLGLIEGDGPAVDYTPPSS